MFYSLIDVISLWFDAKKKILFQYSTTSPFLIYTYSKG